MQEKKIPRRTCIYTGENDSKIALNGEDNKFIRVVRVKKDNKDFDVVIDTSFNGKAVSGRGAYIKKDLETVEMAEKNPNKLKKALNVETLPEDLFVKMKKLVK